MDNVFHRTREEKKKKPKQKKKSNKGNENFIAGHEGYCVRCGEPIEFNPNKPFCFDCLRIWANFANPEYPENYCHRCGKKTDKVSMMKPFCYSCYKTVISYEPLRAGNEYNPFEEVF